MTDQNSGDDRRDEGYDPTHTHRYGAQDRDETAALPPYGAPDQPAGQGMGAPATLGPYGPPPPGEGTRTTVLPPPPPAGYGEPPRRESSRSRSRTAGILVAALLVGAGGGIAGAAGYGAVNGDGSSGGTASEPLQTSNASSSSDTPAAKGSVAAVAKAALPSVVKINVEGAQGSGSGSGIILSSTGEILTNNHVVSVSENGGRMSVSFNDGSTANATIVGTDPITDLAVIKAQGVSGLTPARLGDSDALDVGEEVVAVGSPFGLDATVTEGIVSSLNRPVTVSDSSQSASGSDTAYPAIQTDAAINPGNSGGPLLSMSGEVVGINSSIYSSSNGMSGSQSGSIGLGFAIPISKVLPIVEQLRQGQTPTHARLGVTVSNQQSSEGVTDGAAIQSVTAGSAGEKAGLKSGDVVTKVDDEQITSTESLIATIRGYRPGDKVTLTVERGNETLTLDATLDSDAKTT